MASSILMTPIKRWGSLLLSSLRFLYLCLFVSFCAWLLWKSLTPALPDQHSPVCFYSNQCQQDLTLTFLEAIRQAHHSIDLAIFGLTDSAILKELDRQGKRGIIPKIYYDLNHSPNLSTTLSHCELHPLLQSGLMHQKILILDEEIVFLGSANMTPQSLQMHDNLVFGLYSPKVAAFLKEKAARLSGHLRTLVGKQEIDLWLLPDPKGEALAALRNQIQGARHSIRAALFTFTHPTLLKELVAALRRGIQITLVIDMHSGVGASSKTVEALRKAGIQVLFSQGIQLLHHKFVYIDGESLVAGSANWTQAAFAKNNDCLLILPHLTKEQKTFMNSLWRRLATSAKEPFSKI